MSKHVCCFLPRPRLFINSSPHSWPQTVFSFIVLSPELDLRKGQNPRVFWCKYRTVSAQAFYRVPSRIRRIAFDKGARNSHIDQCITISTFLLLQAISEVDAEKNQWYRTDERFTSLIFSHRRKWGVCIFLIVLPIGCSWSLKRWSNGLATTTTAVTTIVYSSTNDDTREKTKIVQYIMSRSLPLSGWNNLSELNESGDGTHVYTKGEKSHWVVEDTL